MSPAALPSDEVAEDYKSSLEDLVSNDRNQISVLTVIAKENTEHAMAISRVLENHIRTAPPSRKLPALYVLDSLVKNVGTPYTLYLGHNLYETFMNAYVLVDSPIRKKLDEMLKTWKEPIPGSLDTRPVFPLEKSRQIENALIKARTNALARQQTQPRPVQTPPQHYRNGPAQVAPQHRPSQAYQAQPSLGSGAYYNANTQNIPYQNQNNHGQGSTQYQSSATPFNSSAQPPAHAFDLYGLQRDLNQKVQDHQHYVDTHPWNAEVKTKLQMLKDLENHLATRSLGTAQLQSVQKVVSELAPLPQDPQPAIPEPIYQPPPFQASNPPYNPQQQTPASLGSLPISGNLAELIRQSASRSQPTPPPNSALSFLQSAISTPPLDRSTPAPAPIPASTSIVPPAFPAENPILAQLRASGILPATGTPPSGVPTQTHPTVQTHQKSTTSVKIDAQLTSASVKVPRPHLISSLFDGRPNRCTTCGRRFTADTAGKEKKARHLDWHFKTNTRLAESIKRGQHRSWFVDERDWIASREYEDDSAPTGDLGLTSNGTLSTQTTSMKAAKSQEQYVLVPSDPESRNSPCPICQEKFEAIWSEERQEFIWRDAMRVGSKIYHASCYREATKDRERGNVTPSLGQRGRTSRTATPDSVLGKRKKEQEPLDELARVKIKVEDGT